jgi:hypothetical protein
MTIMDTCVGKGGIAYIALQLCGWMESITIRRRAIMHGGAIGEWDSNLFAKVKILFEEQEQVAAAAKDNLVTLQEPV